MRFWSQVTNIVTVQLQSWSCFLIHFPCLLPSCQLTHPKILLWSSHGQFGNLKHFTAIPPFPPPHKNFFFPNLLNSSSRTFRNILQPTFPGVLTFYILRKASLSFKLDTLPSYGKSSTFSLSLFLFIPIWNVVIHPNLS